MKFYVMKKFIALLFICLNIVSVQTMYAQVRMFAEQMPQFEGGESGLKNWINQNMNYPQEALANKEEGRVMIKLIITEDGSVSESKVVRHVSDLLDAEALRLVSQMPKWKPAMQDGKPCSVEYMLPIVFKIDVYEEFADNKKEQIIKSDTTKIIRESLLAANGLNEDFIKKVRQYANIESFSEGMAAIVKGGKWGFIDIYGNEIVPCEYSNVEKFSDGCAAVAKGDKYGYVDKSGKQLVPCQYIYNPHSRDETMTSFYNGLAFVPLPAGSTKQNGASVELYHYKLWGALNKEGKIVIPFNYANYHAFSEGCAAVKKTPYGFWGIIDTEGRLKENFKWSEIGRFHNGLAHAKGEKGDCFIDKNGYVHFSCSYEWYGDFSEGLCPIRRNGKYGYVNIHNQLVILPNYQSASRFSEGVAMVRMNGKYGCINKKGQQIVPCQYDEMQNCSEGLIAVCRNGLWGYVNKQGEEIIPCTYNNAQPFSDGFAVVGMRCGALGYKRAFIDKNGHSTFSSEEIENHNKTKCPSCQAIVKGDIDYCSKCDMLFKP